MVIKEIWKPVSGYEAYEISSTGRVKSLDRVVKKGNGHKRINGRIMKLNSVSGYKQIEFSKNGKGKRFFVHRLVAQAFIENDKNKEEVNHKDFDRANNNVDNLEWVTHKENIKHSSNANRFNVKHEKSMKKVIGVNKKNGNVLILKSIAEGEKYGFYSGNIVSVCKGHRKTTGGYIFNYA